MNDTPCFYTTPMGTNRAELYFGRLGQPSPLQLGYLYVEKNNPSGDSDKKIAELIRAGNSHKALMMALTKAEDIVWRAAYTDMVRLTDHDRAFKWANEHKDVVLIRSVLADAKQETVS